MKTEHVDVIVIGSGGGVKLALPAAAHGMKTVLIERDACGGTCLNRGCIPSKMLIYPCEQVVRLRERGSGLNIRGADGLQVDFPALVQRTAATVDGISAGLEQKFKSTKNLELIHGNAEFVGSHAVAVNGRVISAALLFVATGSRPAVPPVAGLAGTPFMTSREALRCDRLPPRMIVLGGGYIAAELGFVYATAGSDVTFLVRSHLLRQEDPDIAEEFGAAFARRQHVVSGVKLKSVSHAGGLFNVAFNDAEGRLAELQSEALMVATGVEPETEGLGLARAGIQTDERGYIVVDGYLETTVPGVYALGDVIGRYLFRHTVNYEGEYLERTVLGGAARMPIDYGPVPHAVFSSPEVGSVGLTEPQAAAAGFDCLIGTARYADSTPGAARGIDGGLCKLIFDRRSRRLLGAHIVGEQAADLVHMLISAMRHDATLDSLGQTIVIHPALPEVVRDAWRDARKGT